MPNDNIMGIPTKACINGLTKEDTERLKNALIKKIVNDNTVIDITDDGKIIVADGDGLYLSFDGNILGLIKDSSGDYIPQTVPYLPEDANENPLAPPNDTIMTSANIAVDPRIVHTTGNETITGNKDFKNLVSVNDLGWLRSSSGVLTPSKWAKIYEINRTGTTTVMVRIFNDYAMSNFLDSHIIYSVSAASSGYQIQGSFYGVSNRVIGKLARRTDGKIELWVSNSQTSGNISLIFEIEHIRVASPTPVNEQSDTAPIIGETYTEVVDMVNVS